MAQLVQQRTPPYLVIVFGFIALIAIVAAVIFYMDADEATKLAKQREEDIRLLAKPSDRSGDLIEQARTSNKTVVEVLQGQVADLAKYINADQNPTYQAAREEYQTFAKNNPTLEQSGLVPLVNALQVKNANTVKRVDEKDSEIERVRTSLQAKIDMANDKVTAAENTINGLETQLTSLQESKRQREEELTKLKNATEAHYQNMLTERDGRIASLTQEKVNLEMDIRLAKATAENLRLDLQNKHRELLVAQQKLDKAMAGQSIASKPREDEKGDAYAAAVNLAPKPDGEILRVIDDENLCYINVGSKAGAKPYMPFSIYDAKEGIPVTGMNKGTLVVTRVMDNTSECRIVTFDPKNPITIKDVVANVAFDSGLSFDFFVYGQFDLTGKSRATDQGREEVKGIIRQSGGNITDSLSTDTDFLVLGPRPAEPAKPRQGSDLQALATYESRVAKLREYDETQATAMKMGIQILNTTRFIAFTGYSANTPIR